MSKNFSVQEVVKSKLDEDRFDGQYSDSGSSDNDGYNGEEDIEEQPNKEEIKKKSLKKQGKKGSKIRKPKKPQKIVLNVSDTKYRVVHFVGKKINKWRLQYDPEATDWDVMWTDNAVQPEQLGKMSHHQKINHFPGMYCLARKNHLGRNLMKLKKEFPEHYKFFPQTWILPADFNDFKQQFDKKQKGKCKTFIVKPEAGCQGKGIFLTRSLDDFNTTDHYVVQRYLHKPYLIDGLKFDLRIYVLLVGCDPLRVYIYEEGLARFSTEEYQAPNRDNLDDLCMHLTNYAINKDNPNFEFNTNDQKLDVGHKRSLTSIYQYFEKKGHDVVTLKKQIEDIIVKTICCGQPILAHEFKASQPDNYLNNMCFELLGFDIFIDEKLKPYLIEINHTPSFATDTPLDSLIKKNAIRDALKLMNISLKTRNEIISIRREIMQKRVLTGKKVKLTQEEKQEQINIGQEKRNVWENKNCGGYKRLYPLKSKLEKEEELKVAQEKKKEENTEEDTTTVNDGDTTKSVTKKDEEEDEQEEEQKKSEEINDDEDVYIQFMEYASKIYGQSTGANIRRNTKKVTDPKLLEQQNQAQKPNKTKEIEKIYNQKLNSKGLQRTGTSGGQQPKDQQQQPLTLSEKQLQQQAAMQRLSKGRSSYKNHNPNRSDTANTFYQEQQLQQQQQFNQESYQDFEEYDQLPREKEFIIKTSQKNSSYTSFTKKSQENIDSQNMIQTQENNENIPKFYLNQNQRADQKRMMMLNSGSKKMQSHTQGFPQVNNTNDQSQNNNTYNNKSNFIYQQQQQQAQLQQQQQQQQQQNYNSMMMKIKDPKKSKYVVQQQQFQMQYQGNQSNPMYNMYQMDMGNRNDGGLFVTPKLFDLNTLQKNYGGGDAGYSNSNADIYRKINVGSSKNPKKQQEIYQQSQFEHVYNNLKNAGSAYMNPGLSKKM